MPRNHLTRSALIAAVVLGALGLFHPVGEGAIQSFAPTGSAAIDWKVCYGGAYPVADGAGIACGAGSSDTTVPRDTSLVSYETVEVPPGARLTQPITYTPANGITEWQYVAPACAPLDLNNECTAAASAGDMSARTDFACDLGQDILAEGGAGGSPSLWPDAALWTPPALTRTSAAAALGGGGPPTGGPNAYVPQLVPVPTSGPNAFSFRSIDTGAASTLYIGGATGITIPGGPVRVHIATYEAPYASQPGLNIAVPIAGGDPAQPPDDSFNCQDSPQDSVVSVSYLRTPDADRVIPRWITATSAFDLQDSSLDRILDWQCITVGTGEPDADGDCLPDIFEPAAGACVGSVNDKDCDNDLVPDGVEQFAGSNPGVVDTDNDGATDFDELFQFTNSQDADSEDDGQADKLDDRPTNGMASGSDAPTTGTDAAGAAPNGVLDDNCPAAANASQRNSDSMWRFHGTPPSFTAPGAGTGDRSNPDEDVSGDACDTDDDNDDMNDISEAAVTIVPWTGFSGANTTVCAGPGAGVLTDYVDTYAEDAADYTGHLNPLLGDVDQDYFLDGRECQLRSRPDQSIRNGVLALDCRVSLPAPPLDEGCAQPAGPSVGGASDGDNDGLYLPGGGAASNVVIEKYFRTLAVTTAPGVQDNDFDFPQTCAAPVGTLGDDGAAGNADRDSDRDWICPALGPGATLLIDGVEARIYGTNPSAFDTDQDGCPDGEEIPDMNGDGAPGGSIDQAILAPKLFLGPLDNNADGMLDDYATGVNFDLNKDGAINSIDQAFLGVLVVANVGGNCISAFGFEDNVDIGRLTAGLP